MRTRLPNLSQIIPVYAVIAFLAFGWMIYVVIYKIPSWLYFFTPVEILASLAYLFNQVFWDSLIMLAALLLTSTILPAQFLHDHFVVRGAWIALVVMASIVAYLYLSVLMHLPFWMWSLVTFFLAAIAASFATRLKWMSRLALQVSDTLTIFLYIYVPLSALSILGILIRNIR